MVEIEHHATNIIEKATVTVAVGEPQTIDAEYVEYCVSSGYVNVVNEEGNSTIAHISNVAIHADEDASQRV